MSTYPKASAPVTPETEESANQRADRWRKRCEDARTERDHLAAAVKALRDECERDDVELVRWYGLDQCESRSARHVLDRILATTDTDS